MTNLRKVLSIVVIAVLLSTIATMVFATNDGFIVIDNTNVDANNTTGVDNNTAGIDNNAVNPLGNTSNTSTYNNTVNNTVSNLPKTGAGDYTMVLTIVGLAIVAVYAYKKISDYKNI